MTNSNNENGKKLLPGEYIKNYNLLPVFERIIDIPGICFIVLDENAGYVYGSYWFENLDIADREKIMEGISSSSLSHKERADKRNDEKLTVLLEVENRIVRLNGYHIEGGDGSPPCFIWLGSQGLSEMHEIQRIRKNEAEIRRLLLFSGNGILVANPESYIIEKTNDQFVKLFGEGIGNNLVHSFNWTNPSLIEAFLKNIREEKLFNELSTSLLSVGGVKVYVDLVMRKQMMQDGVKLICSIQDTTGINLLQEKLNFSKMLLNKSLNASDRAIIIFDPADYSIIDTNEKTLKLYGIDRNSFLELKFDKLIRDKEKLREVIKQNCGSVKISSQPEMLVSKMGDIVPVELHLEFFETAGKRFGIASVECVSEGKKQRQALDRYEEKFNSLINASPDLVYIKDGVGNWEAANYTARFLFRLDQIHFQSKSNEDLSEIFPELKTVFEGCARTDRIAWERRSIHREDAFIPAPRGAMKVFDMIKVPVFHPDGRRKFLIVIGRDITERKLTKEALRKSEEQFRSLFENSTVGIYRTTYSGDFIIANDAFINMLGYRNFGELENINSNDIYLHPTDKKEFIRIAETFGRVKGFETALTKKNGEEIYVRINSRPIRNDSGEIESFEGMVEDITEIKKAEKKLIHAKEEAEKSDILKSEFLAQMSHEIRTPINTLLNSAFFIRESIAESINEDLKNCFNIIDNSGIRIIRTIDLILNMSEVQTGTYDYREKELDIYENILKELLNEFRILAESKGITLAVNIVGENTRLTADEYSVKQIFSNIIDNAIKFTDAGEISIKLDREDGDDLIVEISDTGVGISEVYLPNLFKPFTQEEQGYTRKYEGNGLGLALVKKYCEINNASIEVESRKDHGSTFKVIFRQT